MLTPRNTKAVTESVTAGRCPKCQQPARRMPTGVFCTVDGLTEDPTTYLHTSPDPISEKIRQDPDRNAARVRMEAAQQVYDAAVQAWGSLLIELNSVRIRAKHDAGSWDPGGAGWFPSPVVKRLRTREGQLVKQLDPVLRAKERAEEDLEHARLEYQQVHGRVSGRHGRPVLTGNVTSDRLTTVIPLTV